MCHHSFRAIICSAQAIQQRIGYYVHTTACVCACMCFVSMHTPRHVFCEHVHTPRHVRAQIHTYSHAYIYIDKLAPNSVLYYAGQQEARNTVNFRCLSICISLIKTCLPNLFSVERCNL